MKSIPLKKNILLPLVGLGTWRLQDEECTEVVKRALDLGYRHIDTAHVYANHNAIHKAIEGFNRRELFLTSKMSAEQIQEHESDLGVDTACNLALQELGVDYLDLYLLHAPDRKKPMKEVLQRMAELVQKGKIRAFGVSNFTLRHLKEFHVDGISVNQIELHPFLFPVDLLAYCRKQKIVPMAYRSLGKGELLSHPFIIQMAQKYKKTPAQILLHYLTQQNIPVIPKARSKEHLLENLNIFDFQLSDEDMKKFEALHSNKRFCDGSWADFEYI